MNELIHKAMEALKQEKIEKLIERLNAMWTLFEDPKPTCQEAIAPRIAFLLPAPGRRSGGEVLLHQQRRAFCPAAGAEQAGEGGVNLEAPGGEVEDSPAQGDAHEHVDDPEE